MIVVTVVTDPELGWDCVVDVVRGNKEDAKKLLLEDGYSQDQIYDELVFSERTV